MNPKLFKTLIWCGCFLLLAGQSHALDPQNWMKKMNSNQRGRRITQKHTSVAAVRGVDEPSQVDPNARDFDAVAEMERRMITPEQIEKFVKEGRLKEGRAKAQNADSQALSQIANQAALPENMKAAIRPISTEEEVEIGKAVAANVAAQFGVFKDEALIQYVNLVGQAVARFSPRQDVTYRFTILDSPILNAFAAPGGYIFISRGLLQALQNESELAGILGHEVGHVSSRHVIKEIQKQRVVQASIPQYVKASAEKAEWLNQISGLAVQSLWKGLSRDDEMESDRIGLQLAEAAGYDPRSFKTVLQMLKNRQQAPDQVKQLKFLLSTHPKPEDRLQQAEEKLKSAPEGGQILTERYGQNVQF